MKHTPFISHLLKQTSIKVMNTRIILTLILLISAITFGYSQETCKVKKGRHTTYVYEQSYNQFSQCDETYVTVQGFDNSLYPFMGAVYYRPKSTTKNGKEIVLEVVKKYNRRKLPKNLAVYIFCNLQGTVDTLEFKYEGTKIVSPKFFEDLTAEFKRKYKMFGITKLRVNGFDYDIEYSKKVKGIKFDCFVDLK